LLARPSFVEAATEREAIAKAAEQFNISPARRNKIAVTQREDRTTKPERQTR
jgi:hypothetical protein